MTAHPAIFALVFAAVLTASPRALGQDAGSPGSDAPLAEGTDQANAVVQVRVEGNRRVEPEAIKRALRTKEGRPFDPTRTSDDIRALWNLGYFSDVQLLVQRLPKGIVYVVRVEERPAIREVRLSGNDELSKDDLKESIDIRSYSVLDRDAVRKNAKKIQEKYVEKGYFLAEVRPRIEPVADTQEVDVVFDIREHSKIMVKTINFLGAEKVPADELRSVMATKEGGYLSFFTGEGTYREELFQRDLAFLQGAYYDRGFLNVRVEKPWVSISPDKRFIYVSIRIEEGEQYTTGTTDFSGDLLVSKEELHALMGSKPGELFNRSKLQRDIVALTDVYYDRGYAYANITPVTKVNADTRSVDLTFDVQKGQQVSIERIEIVGNTKTRDKVIRRELRIYEGDLFSGTGMRRSKERVTALGFFESVEVSHKPGRDSSHVAVQVEVKEKATGTFQVGLGFSNVENFIFTAQVSQNNALGWGQSVAASAQISGLRQFLQLSYYDPYFLDSNFIFSTDFFKMQSDYFGFIRDSTGGDVNLGYHVLEDVMVNVTYNREYVRNEPGRDYNSQIPYAHQFDGGVISSLRLSATWDKRDNRLFPTNGFMLFGSAEFAPKVLEPIGGTFLFSKYAAYARYYRPLLWGAVFKVNANVGLIQPLAATGSLPISEMYYLGGMNSVRGYTLRSITPCERVGTETRGDANVTCYGVGGNKQAFLNVELEFPVFEKVGIRGVLFYDAGNAFAQSAGFFQDERHPHLPLGLFHSIGFGFRWFSPIGPLRFEWGLPLNRRNAAEVLGGDQPLLFEFTIGNFF